ncbi:MAG: hypothetical protein ACFE8N_03995 [Promethearchaeota archaeon]
MFGDVFLIAIVVFPFMYLVSGTLERIVLRRKYGKLIETAVRLIFFLGVIVHECSHRLMCALTGVPTNAFVVKYRDKKTGIVTPSGRVGLERPLQVTFLQGLLLSFAPLLIGMWIFYFLLLAAFDPLIDPVYRIIAGICSIGVIIASSPSRADLGVIRQSYQNDPHHGLYQIFLLVLSFMAAWGLVGWFNILFPFEFFYYFLIALFYIIFKYGFILLRIAKVKIEQRSGKSRYKPRYKRYVRRRYKPDFINNYKQER